MVVESGIKFLADHNGASLEVSLSIWSRRQNKDQLTTNQIPVDQQQMKDCRTHMWPIDLF